VVVAIFVLMIGKCSARLSCLSRIYFSSACNIAMAAVLFPAGA